MRLAHKGAAIVVERDRVRFERCEALDLDGLRWLQAVGLPLAIDLISKAPAEASVGERADGQLVIEQG